MLFGQGLRPHPARTVAAGAAWFSDLGRMDECAVAYTISISGFPGLTASDLRLSLCHWQLSANDGCFAQLNQYDFVNIDLADSVVFGTVDYLSSNAWRTLSSDGGVYLRVATAANPRGVLAGNVSLAGSERCLQRQLQRDLVVAEDHEANQGPRPTVCEYDGVKYNDGDSWHATRSECTMCSCQVSCA